MDAPPIPFPNRYPFTTVNLRRAYTSYASPGAATNRATHLLYNSSTGPLVIVVRGQSFMGTAASTIIALETIQGPLGTHLGVETPIWQGEAQPAGQHWYVDTATVYTPNLLIAGTTLATNQFVNGPPICVLPPGWSVIFQANAAAQTIPLSWYWEELDIRDPTLGGGFG